jgi:hypothetical protein
MRNLRIPAFMLGASTNGARNFTEKAEPRKVKSLSTSLSAERDGRVQAGGIEETHSPAGGGSPPR